MEKIRKIEEFLKLIANASANGYLTNSNSVYHNLIFFGIEEKTDDISLNFDRWISRFASKRNIDVFVDPEWSYFCQFWNGDLTDVNPYEAIKLYVSLDKEHIYIGANMIFDYLAQENIKHISKIGKKVRFDDVVIRVGNARDANKIINFINKNGYIQEGSLTDNPFAINNGVVSMAWDGMLSYNSVVSSWVSQYIEWEKQRNELNKVSYSRFIAFVTQKKTQTFEQGFNLNEMVDYLRQINMIKTDSSDRDVLNRVSNYYDVTNLMLMVLNNNLKQDDLYGYINKVSSNVYQNSQTKHFNGLINNCGFDSTMEFDDNDIEYSSSQKSAYILAFKYMCEKYGYRITRENFAAYAHNGQTNYITSYKGARNLIVSNGITKEIATMLEKELDKECLFVSDNLDFALDETYKKYDDNWAKYALHRILTTGDLTSFTNNNNARVLLRNSLKNMLTVEDVKFCLMRILSFYGFEFDFLDAEGICEQYYTYFSKNVVNRKR